MLRITGYSDKYSVHPGEKVKFYINSETNENYEVQIVRLIHGDTNPEGPGYKEEELGASCNGNYEGRNQRIHGGSYVIIPQDDRMNAESLLCRHTFFLLRPIRVNKEYLQNGTRQIILVMDSLLMMMVAYA